MTMIGLEAAIEGLDCTLMGQFANGNVLFASYDQIADTLIRVDVMCADMGEDDD